MTARPPDAPPGGSGIGLFLVPAYRDEDRRQRNGYRIDRLKDKLGTCELATAEVTFANAKAYAVGPLDRGLANLVSDVLVTSRFACLCVAAAFLRRAERIATAYAAFRTAFGHKLHEYALVREPLEALRIVRERSLASVFRLLRMWQAAEFSRDEQSEEALDFRYMLGLCKVVFTRLATDHVHDAMLVLGANGLEEQFSPLPRLWRDAVVMETWEGPHNVLLTQALRDMRRFEIDPARFVERMAGERRRDLVEELAAVLHAGNDSQSPVRFARWAPNLVAAFADHARAVVDTR